MQTRKERRKQKQDKWKQKIANGILIVMLAIGIWVILGMYQENTIFLQEGKMPVLTNQVIQQVEKTQSTGKSTEKVSIAETYQGFTVAAKLMIPKLELETNVLQEYSAEGMEVCVSKFWGVDANEIGNFCIAGHNYQKENKFYRLTELETGDELYLLDNKNGKYRYIVSAIYQVKPENTSPIDQETNGKRMVTLITCTKYSKNRIIVQALEG